MQDVQPYAAASLPAAGEPRIVLVWLTRLRWLAIAGQIAATAVAVFSLHLRLPVWPIAAVVLVTAITNLFTLYWMNRPLSAAWLVPSLVILDICLLTALLYCTGGPDNPFSSLYLVHVAMAVAVLPTAWTWGIVAAVSAAYGLLFWRHLPLAPPGSLAAHIVIAGRWVSLVLVAALIAYFIGRITRALRWHERQLAAAHERATRNEQLAALTTLAAGAAHELSTPLGTIAVVAKELELACEGISLNGELSEDARLIREEVDRCRSILDRMRVEVIRESADAGAAQALVDLLEQVRADLKPAERSRLRIGACASVDLASGPAHAVQQALGVLVRNAFDATPADESVELRIQRDRDRVIFEVEDHGCGMDADVLRHAGEPFFTTKPPGKGMGLGLFLVRMVAERYGGNFNVDSYVGRGTRCVLELPQEKVAAPS